MLVNHLPVRYKEPLSRNHSHGHKWIYHPKIVSISIAILQFRCPRMMVKKTIIRGHSSFHPHVVGNSCGIICRTIFYFPCDSESASKKACSLRRALKQRSFSEINFFIHRFCLPRGGDLYIIPPGNPPSFTGNFPQSCKEIHFFKLHRPVLQHPCLMHFGLICCTENQSPYTSPPRPPI